MHSSAQSTLKCIVKRSWTTDAETGDVETGNYGTEKDEKFWDSEIVKTIVIFKRHVNILNSTYPQQKLLSFSIINYPI